MLKRDPGRFHGTYFGTCNLDLQKVITCRYVWFAVVRYWQICDHAIEAFFKWRSYVAQRRIAKRLGIGNTQMIRFSSKEYHRSIQRPAGIGIAIDRAKIRTPNNQLGRGIDWPRLNFMDFYISKCCGIDKGA